MTECAGIYFDMPRNARDRLDVVASLFPRYRNQFGTRPALQNYLMTTYVPVSRRWVYKTNAKSGSSSVLSMLFAIEFGVPFSVKLKTTKDHNPDTALHQMREAHVFEPVLNLPDVADVPAFLEKTLSFTVVRDPAARVLSSFHYLCQSNEAESEKFLRDRIRLSALTGFDWGTHPRTVDGFRRFLEYIVAESEQEGVMHVNNHWRPQWRNVQMDLLKPDLVGRLEDMPAFYRELCKLLDRPLPEHLVSDRRNRQNRLDPSPFVRNGDCRRLIRKIFARDYELFGYDADRIGR